MKRREGKRGKGEKRKNKLKERRWQMIQDWCGGNGERERRKNKTKQKDGRWRMIKESIVRRE